MDSFAHGSANLQMNCGRILQGHPSLGAWVAHGLGSTNPNLPGFVVMLDARGGPIPGAANWASGYMPAAYQGTILRSKGNPILNLKPNSMISHAMQGDKISAINAFNELHKKGKESYSELSARIASYDLAYQLHTSAPEALNISSENEQTKRLYGLHMGKGEHKLSIPTSHFGRQCLIARRLVERGLGLFSYILEEGTSNKTGTLIMEQRKILKYMVLKLMSLLLVFLRIWIVVEC